MCSVDQNESIHVSITNLYCLYEILEFCRGCSVEPDRRYEFKNSNEEDEDLRARSRAQDLISFIFFLQDRTV